MTPTTGVAVIGAGGHGKVVIATLQAAGVAVAGAFDDDQRLWGQSVLGVEVVGSSDAIAASGNERLILGVGDNRRRHDLARRLAAAGLDWQTVIHPSAVVHPSVRLGAGTVVFAGAIVQPETRIGRHAIVNTGALIDHDCSLGDFVHVAPGVRLAGGVKIGHGAFLGIGCSLLPGVSIGDWAVVGAGAAVVRDVAPGTTVKGVPAR